MTKLCECVEPQFVSIDTFCKIVTTQASMKNILYISAHFPSEHSTLAGHKCAYKILKEYDDTAKVDLLVASNPEELDSELVKNLRRTRLILFVPLTRLSKLINILFSGRIFPLKVWSRYSRPIINYLQQNAHNYDIIHFEFTHAAAVFSRIIRDKRPGQVWIVSCHDILIQGKLRQGRRLGSLIRSSELAATFSFEAELFDAVDVITVLSSKDAKLIESLYSISSEKIRIIEPYTSPFTENVLATRSPETIERKTLLYWGAMNRQENDEAVILFLRKYGAVLRENDYILYVVGNKPSHAVQQFRSEHVIVTGFVEDPFSYFIKCELGIVPLLSGAGIKIKTLEMLKSGLHVVSTPIGAEGITHNNLHVTRIDNFYETIEALHYNKLSTT